MKQYLSEQEFTNIVMNMTEKVTISLETEEGQKDAINFQEVDFGGGIILYNLPISTEIGILQDNIFGDIEENIRELYNTLEEYLYQPYIEI